MDRNVIFTYEHTEFSRLKPQDLVEQLNGMVKAKIIACKMNNESTKWAGGLLKITLAINTQKHSTTGCAPAELLF